jgi:hypothetical protein
VVWLYGFIPMTRRRYTFQLVIAFGLAVGFVMLWGIYWPTFRKQLTDPIMGPGGKPVAVELSPAAARVVFFGDIVQYVIGAFVALQLVEAYFVFGMLTRKEKEEAEAAQAAPPEAKA